MNLEHYTLIQMISITVATVIAAVINIRLYLTTKTNSNG